MSKMLWHYFRLFGRTVNGGFGGVYMETLKVLALEVSFGNVIVARCY